MRVLIDTNILLDFLLQREPFCHDAERLFQAIDSGQIVGYATATTLTDIFYIDFHRFPHSSNNKEVTYAKLSSCFLTNKWTRSSPNYSP
ncbi:MULTISPECIES: PIN domain-containing protein [Spirulina]|uniref:PIN domain-containing protein n=1 Tax=Spirulina TaxID=1154 RepID=UPI002FEE595B